MTRRRDAVVRRGLGHVRRAIVEQPGMFTLAVVASSLYGAMTVASAWVIGEITDRVILPAFADGVDHRCRPVPRGRRRHRGGAAQDRRDPRPAVVRRHHELPAAGRLPAPGHPPVPAAAAVLAPEAPHRPAAVQRELRRRGVLVLRRAPAVRLRRAGDDRDHRGGAVPHRPADRPRRAGRLPARLPRQRRLLAGHEPADAAGAAAARRGQRDRARELRRGARGQDPGPGDRRDRALPGAGPRSCATVWWPSAACAGCSTR